MKYTKNTFKILLLVCLSACFSAYAINITVKDNIVEAVKKNRIEVSKKSKDIIFDKKTLPAATENNYSGISKPSSIAIVPPIEPNKKIIDAKKAIKVQSLPNIKINKPSNIIDMEPDHSEAVPDIKRKKPLASYAHPVIRAQNADNTKKMLSNETARIFQARSVTSNNPEYKTRFSIIHNTPSPKRIGGERLYNLSDASFRMAVTKNKIQILDNPVFNLTGINSGKGRYGEMRVLDGASLKIHGTSKRFKGKWDIDGTGARNLKVTPTNLVSGKIPVHIKTFTPTGKILTNEKHVLSFKALAMGPYNGYWTDGIDFSIFLWGMSNSKLKSKEMSYLGVDLGIVTEIEPEEVGDDDLVSNVATNSIVPISNSGSPSSIIPFGGNGFTGGFGGFGGFGGGFGGGGGNPVLPNPCFGYGPDGSLIDLTDILPECKPICVRDPNDPKCTYEYCYENPFAPTCPDFCKHVPDAPKCCEATPNGCPDPCDINPDAPNCQPECVKNPSLPECQIDPCTQNPSLPECQVDPCIENPSAPECNPGTCIENPNLPQCKPDVCVEYPELPECTPTNPVSAPFAPFVFLVAILGFIYRRRR